MIFASGVFLYYFLPVFLALYYLSPRYLKSYVIAVASYLFYGWWRPDFVILMLISTVVDYTCGEYITKAHEAGRKGKQWLIVSLVVNLGLLGYFKYVNFGIDSLNILLDSCGISPVRWMDVVLPVGISFYTFQTMSYTIDVYRGTSPPVRNFRDFMCYVAMFPQLVAGPIVRYNTIADQLHTRDHTTEKFFRGILFFQCGLAKKVLIADTLGYVANQAFDGTVQSMIDSWMGVVAYAFQIFFDFSGYSDMAIGLGFMMGFRFPINFNQPYRAVSITDFWRRWHISLSSFLRDYLYMPLGGNRKGSVRTYVNLSITMLLGGLWHGAAWNFIVWGAYQGFWLVIERLFGKRSLYGRAPRWIQIGLTFIVALFGWVFFRAPDLAAAGAFFKAMFGLGPCPLASLGLEIRPLHYIMAATAVLWTWGAPSTQVLIPRIRASHILLVQIVFIITILHMHFQDHVPFLYYQF